MPKTLMQSVVSQLQKLRAESPESTLLSTETRIKCFGQAALWKFRIYWSLVGPFSGLMRKAILKQIKTEAESKAKSGARDRDRKGAIHQAAF